MTTWNIIPPEVHKVSIRPDMSVKLLSTPSPGIHPDFTQTFTRRFSMEKKIGYVVIYYYEYEGCRIADNKDGEGRVYLDESHVKELVMRANRMRERVYGPAKEGYDYWFVKII